jgi:hypothetical protein
LVEVKRKTARGRGSFIAGRDEGAREFQACAPAVK